ncbi:L-threonine 3-dehydrogenase [Vibrio gigantis]
MKSFYLFNIAHHYKVDDFQAGFDMMRSGMSGKVILDWE